LRTKGKTISCSDCGKDVSEEPQYSLSPNKKNTYGIGPDGDDEEFLAWMAETSWNAGSADKEDWAKPGKQWPN